MNVSLRQLQVFQSVAVTRNFSRTGDQVGLTQPAVSRCITELETQLGLKLLNRTTREVGLTDAGHSLAARLTGCWKTSTACCWKCAAWPATSDERHNAPAR